MYATALLISGKRLSGAWLKERDHACIVNILRAFLPWTGIVSGFLPGWISNIACERQLGVSGWVHLPVFLETFGKESIRVISHWVEETITWYALCEFVILKTLFQEEVTYFIMEFLQLRINVIPELTSLPYMYVEPHLCLHLISSLAQSNVIHHHCLVPHPLHHYPNILHVSGVVKGWAHLCWQWL